MLQSEHSAILLTFTKLPFVIKTFVLSIFEWPLKTGFTVLIFELFAFWVILHTFLSLSPMSVFSTGLLMLKSQSCSFQKYLEQLKTLTQLKLDNNILGVITQNSN